MTDLVFLKSTRRTRFEHVGLRRITAAYEAGAETSSDSRRPATFPCLHRSKSTICAASPSSPTLGGADMEMINLIGFGGCDERLNGGIVENHGGGKAPPIYVMNFNPNEFQFAVPDDFNQRNRALKSSAATREAASSASRAAKRSSKWRLLSSAFCRLISNSAARFSSARRSRSAIS